MDEAVKEIAQRCIESASCPKETCSVGSGLASKESSGNAETSIEMEVNWSGILPSPARSRVTEEGCDYDGGEISQRSTLGFSHRAPLGFNQAGFPVELSEFCAILKTGSLSLLVLLVYYI